jgi:putative membrane protein
MRRLSRRSIQRLAWLGALGGVALLAALIGHEGWTAIAATFSHAGWALLLVVPARVLTLGLDTRAWRVLLDTADPQRAAGPLFLFWVASVREAFSRLLPVAGVGGEVIGVRLMRLRIADTTLVTASIVVEILLTIVVLYLFCGLGVVLMTRLAAGVGQVWVVAAALLLSLPLPLLAWWLLRHGAPFERLQRMAENVLGPQNEIALSLDGVRLDAGVRRLLEQPARLVRAGGWSLLSYLLGSFETWYALRLLGYPVGVEAALAIEALIQATRHASFMVPAGLGVQEAATLLFGHLAGVGGDVALSLALVKRMRELLFGIPALLSWYRVEVRQAAAAVSSPVTPSDYGPPGT